MMILLLSNSENRELPKDFRNVDRVLSNHNKVQDSLANLKPQTTVITVAACSLVISHFIGLFLATQKHSINTSGVHGFVSFTVILIIM